MSISRPDRPDEVDSHFWWHSIRLADGRVTPGFKPLDYMEREFSLALDPVDLKGRTVLDVGAWTGGFSIEAKRRGARRVVALDHATWNSPQHRGREAFDLAVRLCGLEIEAVDQDLDSPNLSLQYVGDFDVVLFLGVFYHLLDPIAALREVAARAREVLVIETHVERDLDRPYMEYYPDGVNGDRSNYWGPNPALIQQLLKRFGFSIVLYNQGSDDTRAMFHAFRSRNPMP